MKLIDPAHTYKANCIVIIDLVEDLAYFADGMKEIIKLLEELGIDVTNMREVQEEILKHAKELYFITTRLAYLPERVEEQLKNVYVLKDEKNDVAN